MSDLGNILAAALDAQADPRRKRPYQQADQSAPLLGRTRMPPDLEYDDMPNTPARLLARLDWAARARR
jgi:hypothetical protein